MEDTVRRNRMTAEIRPLELCIGYRFGLIATRIGAMAAKQYMARYQLSAGLWRALTVVAHFESLSASTLSQHARLDPAKVSRAIEAVLTLTARGRAIDQDIAASITQLEDGMSATLSSAERALWSMISKIDQLLPALRQQHQGCR